MDNKNRIASLDGLRAVSILLVIFCHLVNTDHFPDNKLIHFAWQYGNFGVQVFFVLSGFLITKLLIKEHDQNGTIDLCAFYRRRAYRILPASLLYTTLTIIATVAVGNHLTAGYVLALYGFCAGYASHAVWQLGHLWSLGAEEQFYLLWPFMLVAFFRFRTMIAVTIVLASAVYRAHPLWSITYSFPAVADSMAIGALLAIYYPFLSVLPRRCWSTPVALILSAATLGSVPLIHTRNAAYWGIEPFLIAATLFVLVQRKDWILNNGPIRFVGALSYSLYLVQQPFLNRYAHTLFNMFPLNLFFALMAALALHFGVERPMLLLGIERQRRAKLPRATVREGLVGQLVDSKVGI